MTQTAINYAKVLYELNIPQDVIAKTQSLVKENPQLMDVLMNPVVSFPEKEHVIDRIFPSEMQNFFKVLTRYHSADCLPDIFIYYENYAHEKQDILDATLYYVTPPTEEQIEGIKAKLAREYHRSQVDLELIQRQEVMGGFVVKVGDVETDYSILGRINDMRRQLVKRNS
ncbi:MAG: ATP synthase F1 subunit delta [Lachnospiraceae bacterium]|nr:ATP synthase F1 subunit delta [Lachnospiraceae bacterium]